MTQYKVTAKFKPTVINPKEIRTIDIWTDAKKECLEDSLLGQFFGMVSVISIDTVK